ncbi:MAG TPA: GGDEF-domain containing protein, partial [Erythrobacter sp.]|nr:GGDEF-domain containing protein [Erythrobacter sp.]
QVPDRVDQLATRMVENVARPVEYGDMPVDVTMSIGIASSTQMDNVRDGTAAAQTLMHKADIAMYHAKKQGKNRFYWFEPQMENELRFRNELEAGIRRGIVNG